MIRADVKIRLLQETSIYLEVNHWRAYSSTRKVSSIDWMRNIWFCRRHTGDNCVVGCHAKHLLQHSVRYIVARYTNPLTQSFLEAGCCNRSAPLINKSTNRSDSCPKEDLYHQFGRRGVYRSDCPIQPLVLACSGAVYSVE